MRILEPDGITIDYADKKFQDGEPVVNSDENNIGAYPNWTHNILTVNYPLDKILPNFDKNNFHKGNNGISLGAIQDGDEEFSITLPNIIEIPGSGWQRYTDDENVYHDNRISFRPLKHFNNTDLYEEDPFDEIDETNIDKDSCFLTITKEGQIKYKSPKAVATKTDVAEWEERFTPRTHTIEIGDGLQLTNKDDSDFSGSIMTLSLADTNWRLDVKPDNFSIEQVKNGVNPWQLDNGGTYNYSGNCGYFNGTLKTTNSYEWDYQYIHVTNAVTGQITGKKERDDFKSVITDKYEHNKLVSLNYLKTPYTIHTSTSGGNVKAQFINLPFITNIGATGGTFENCPYAEYNPTPTAKHKSSTETKVELNPDTNEKETFVINTSYEVKDYYEFVNLDSGNYLNADTYRVPAHANSVLLQVTHSDGIKIYTNSDYSSLTTGSKCLLDTNSGGTHVIELTLHDGIHLSSSKVTGVSVSIDGIPVENNGENFNKEDKHEYTSSFQYLVSTSGSFTISLLGYRV